MNDKPVVRQMPNGTLAITIPGHMGNIEGIQTEYTLPAVAVPALREFFSNQRTKCPACGGGGKLTIGYADGTEEEIDCGFCSGEGSYNAEQRAADEKRLRAFFGSLMGKEE